MLDFSGAMLGKKPSKRPREPSAKPAPKPSSKPQKKKPSRLQRFEGGVFRWLNEQLYTQDSSHSLDLFASNPHYFAQYHKGFQQQQAVWPVKPLEWVRGEVESRDTGEEIVLADLGCGEGQLASDLQSRSHIKVLSFDLFQTAPHVTVADIAHLPLQAGTVDIAVFCLSLMGANHVDFLREARRVLKRK
jgi:ribosomal RNA-processing protein 8